MNSIFRALVSVPHGYLKLLISKLFHPSKVKFGSMPRIDHSTEISFQGSVLIGKRLNMRKYSILRCRKNAFLKIGNNVSFGPNNMVVCLESISIGDGCEFGPGVLVFDHDHDFKTKDGLKPDLYKKSPIKIGKNVWIGANSIILRGTTIGDNCVVAAGSVLNGGEYPSDTLIVQKRCQR